MTGARCTLLCVLLALTAAPASAQFPAELAGRVVEAGSAAPVEGAVVEVGTGWRTLTDAAGTFVLRVPATGEHALRVTRTGYTTLERIVTVEAGRRTLATFALEPAPLELAALEVAVTPAAPGFVIARAAIEASGARTLGELVALVPGVVVREQGGSERVSVRGSNADAVLVLVDGVPANDPVTGEADLSLVALDGVGRVRVLPGAQSARYGPRAEAGAILVESLDARDAEAGVMLRSGSLGERALHGNGALRVAGIDAAAGVRVDALRSRFDYERPASLGGGSETRANAEELETGAWIGLGWQGGVAGALRVRVEHNDLERGLPGPMHAPTPSAGQEVARTQVAASWLAALRTTSIRLDAHASWQRLRFEDAEPPLGQPYFDTTRVREGGARLELERVAGARARIAYALGGELRWTRLESTTLEPADLTHSQPGVFARGALELDDAPLRPGLSLALRADRWDGTWTLSHDAALRLHAGPVTLSAAHRSAFSPPAASDQFFRGGFAIEPNPALEPERVPGEIELSISSASSIGGVPIALGAGAFRADIDGMIVWSPDFRFVWSPRNHDVLRRGGEAWLRAGPWRGVEAGAWASVARVTYDWPGDADTVQVVYRPRHSGGATLDWRPGAWRLGASALYTGVRYATPGESNPLPAFWELDAVVSREWLAGPLRVIGALRVDRLLDNTDSFVHGFPEPGRTLRLELRVHAADASNSDFTDTET